MMKNKPFQQTKEWYMSAVKSELILSCGMNENEADKAIDFCELGNRIDECHDIAFHDAPLSTAEDVYVEYTSQ